VSDEASARKDLAGYYAHIAALDFCAGRIMEALAEAGLTDETILVFTADHGDMLWSRGETRKQRPWDESIRVPFLIHYPARLGGKGRKLTTPIGTPDIMPTLLGLCGIPVPKTVEGRDRSRLVAGKEPERDDAALIECVSPFGEWTRARGGREYRGIRTRRYTYARTLDGPWLLYDNGEDPFQGRNLAGLPEAARLQARMEEMLRGKMKETHDRFLPGADYIKKWGYKTDANGTVPYNQ
jgi:arylsulfatase A-like enzyme